MFNLKPQLDKVAEEIFEKLGHTKKNDVRHYLGMSQIGKPCDRELWYHYREYTPKPLTGRILAIFDIGNVVENLLIGYLRTSYNVKDVDPETNSQYHFSDWNNQFQGNADGIISMNGKDRILECKSVNKANFAVLKNKGVRDFSATYYCQMQCYMGYSGLDRAFFVAMCKDNSDIYTEKVYFSFDDYVSLVDRAYNIITAQLPPERISDDANSVVCKYCPYRLHCFYPEEALLEPVCKNCKHWIIDENCVGKCQIKNCTWESI